jgi:hypothetical protein
METTLSSTARTRSRRLPWSALTRQRFEQPDSSGVETAPNLYSSRLAYTQDSLSCASRERGRGEGVPKLQKSIEWSRNLNGIIQAYPQLIYDLDAILLKDRVGCRQMNPFHEALCGDHAIKGIPVDEGHVS